MNVIVMGVGAMLAVIALMVVGAQLSEFVPLIVEASGADSPVLRRVISIPTHMLLLLALMPVVIAIIGIIGLRRY